MAIFARPDWLAKSDAKNLRFDPHHSGRKKVTQLMDHNDDQKGQNDPENDCENIDQFDALGTGKIVAMADVYSARVIVARLPAYPW